MERPRDEMVDDTEDLVSISDDGCGPLSMSIDSPKPICCIQDKNRKTSKNLLLIPRRLDLTNDLSLYYATSKLVSDPDWETWRNSLVRVLGGHTVASLFGFGAGDLVSPNKAFRVFTGLDTKQEPNWFAKRAMSHGKDIESIVKQIVLLKSLAKGTTLVESSSFDPETIVYEIRSETIRTPINICISPDIHRVYNYNLYPEYLNPQDIVEIKCPYYGSDKFESPIEFMNWSVERFQEKYSVSFNPAWWLQAAFYSYITGCNWFTLAIGFYTTGTDKIVVAEYGFVLPEMFLSVMGHQLGHFMKAVENNQSSYKPFPSTKAVKKTILELIKDSFTIHGVSPVYNVSIDGSISISC